jgi:colanic acid biosynthesis glycosyl transferase WcaI
MATRILMITQWFDPEPTFKGLIFARELMRQGFDVEVVTGFPNYPGGKLYPGYKMRLLSREIIEGVAITRVPLYPSHNHSGFGRVLNYASFAGSALIYGLFFAKRADVIYTYHPPLTVGISASLIRIIRRIPVVYDVQDLWPDTLKATGMFSNRIGLRLVAAVCRWVYRTVDHLVVLSPGFKRLLNERGVPLDKIDVIYNWCNEDAIDSPLGGVPAEFPGADRFRILYAGNIGKAQALDAVLDAAEILKELASNVVFVFLGGGLAADHLRSRARGKGINNVVFLPAVPMSEVGTILNCADALLVHLRKDPLFDVTIPSKTQAYMAIGKPILMAVGGDAARLVTESLCGIVAESENAVSIAAAAVKLMASGPEARRLMSENAKRFYKEHMALAIGVRRFAGVFVSLSSDRKCS